MSLVEAGQRFPRQGLLRDVAAFFGVPLEYLVTGNAGAERLQIDVDFAEMALRNGDPAAALAQFAAIEQHASPLIHGPVRRQAQC
jgi:transcriptional regulator with XRE-family HTH domain